MQQNILFIKDIKKGLDIKAKYIYQVKNGDFVYSRLFAWKGSFAVARDEFDGCYVSNEFPCFQVDEDNVYADYLLWYFNQLRLWDECFDSSEGSTAISRNRLKVDKFLSIELVLPSLEKQRKIMNKLTETNSKIQIVSSLKEKVESEIEQLRQSILQEAVQGKIVPQNPNDEPAKVLLKNIEEKKLISSRVAWRPSPMRS